MFTLNVFFVIGLVGGAAGYAVCELRDPSGHEMVHVERDSPNRDCFIAVRKQCQIQPLHRIRFLTYLFPACKRSIQYP